MFSRIPNVDQCRLRRQIRIIRKDHNCCVTGKAIDEGGKATVAHLHRLELGAQLRAGQLELLYYVGDLLEAVRISVLSPLAVRYDEECGPLEEKHFVSVDYGRKGLQGRGRAGKGPQDNNLRLSLSLYTHHQSVLQCLHIGDQHVHDVRPGAVECLIPDGCLEAGAVQGLGQSLKILLALLEYLILLLLRHQIHLVHETEDFGVGRVVQYGLQAGLVVVHVSVQLPALYIEDVDKDGDIPEDVVFLRLKVLLHERLLPATVPEVQHQIAQESDV